MKLLCILAYLPTFLVMAMILVMLVAFFNGWRIHILGPVPIPTPTPGIYLTG